ncbi:ABC transporter substrate-binding protein [Bacillus sp. 1P02SD]|uniref:ABC transporter substrate-binding protein n=1 Tax=Bacillus sp. 1P02SD TaxID=3132264 RepID=UPI0039A02E6D
MKKVFSFLLAVFLLLVVAACTNDSSTDTKEPDSNEPSKETVTNDPAEETEYENPLADPRVRQAINYAIDKQAIVEQILQGKAIVADSLTPNGDWKTDGLDDYAYDPEKAKQLLKEANWDPNYVIDAVVYYGDQQTVDLMTAVQAYLSQVGMKMEFRKLEGDLAAQLWVPPSDPKNGPSAVKWDIAYGAIAALSMHEYYDRFMSGFPSNSHTPTDPKLDELIQATNATTDLEEQKKAFYALQKYENESLPLIPLYYQQVFVAQSDRLDRANSPYGNEQFNYDWNIVNWDIKPDSSGKKVMKTNGGPVQFFETPFLNPGNYMSTKVLFDHLIVADENLNPKEGELASDYTVSEDGKTITFTLRDGIKWHDGSPITPEDVKWTFEIATKVPTLNAVFMSSLNKLEGYQEYVDGAADEISGIVIEGNTITFNFENLAPDALLMFTQLPPLPKKHFDGVDPLQMQQSAFWQAPIGSGPFKIKEVSMNNFATFVPFEDYHRGVAKIEEIQMYPSAESDPNLVKNAAAKQLDYAYTKSVQDVLSLEDMSHMTITPVDIRYTRLFFINKFPKE